jgi:pyruvate formate lyase activating enzyme
MHTVFSLIKHDGCRRFEHFICDFHGIAAELFTRARKLGITTCLDTAAGPFRRDDKDIARLIDVSDTVLLDIKAFDGELHRRITGVDNAAVLDCARYLSEIRKPVWIRRVIVPGLTDGEDDLYRLRDFIGELSNVKKTEVLAYHDMGAVKWKALGLSYALEGVRPAGDDDLARARRILKAENPGPSGE